MSQSILFVDDDEGVCASMQALLELLGHDVRIARSVEEAVMKMRRRRPEVLICDYGLGDETPLRLTEHWQFDNVPLRILFTGHSVDELAPSVLERFSGVVFKHDGTGALLSAFA